MFPPPRMMTSLSLLTMRTHPRRVDRGQVARAWNQPPLRNHGGASCAAPA